MVTSIRDSIWKLQFLEVFDMGSSSSETTLLPKGIWMMNRLRHRNVHRRMQFSDLAGRMQVDALKNLQVFPVFYVFMRNLSFS
ncbi:hypothetical protein FNV43_RR00809 [Rhamnella rubrinervis]|uniref:Uncharacterized protein n=1 Tax=Rhamnella rubrinervis TaxID=2594499 RepID=A0A8K0HPU6_9ROSA|nr:hypothetical protein FNV43_RR00809 [Rhamnella rubrinervis]